VLLLVHHSTAAVLGAAGTLRTALNSTVVGTLFNTTRLQVANGTASPGALASNNSVVQSLIGRAETWAEQLDDLAQDPDQALNAVVDAISGFAGAGARSAPGVLGLNPGASKALAQGRQAITAVSQSGTAAVNNASGPEHNLENWGNSLAGRHRFRRHSKLLRL
jgi:hypothetical protein